MLLAQGREVYNAALAQCKGVYETRGKHQTAISQWAYFRAWRKQDGIYKTYCRGASGRARHFPIDFTRSAAYPGTILTFRANAVL